jgi:gas vesicle protein
MNCCTHDWLKGLDGAYDSADYRCVRCGAEHNGPDRPDRGPVPPPKRLSWTAHSHAEHLSKLSLDQLELRVVPDGSWLVARELLRRYRELEAKREADLVAAARPVLGTEPTYDELADLDADAYSSAQEADCAAKQSVYYDAARRALYLAGSASRQAELDELRASERAAQERAKELEDDLTQMRDLLSPDWQNQTELGGQVMLALKKARDEANQAEERTTTAEARVAELQARLLPGCER